MNAIIVVVLVLCVTVVLCVGLTLYFTLGTVVCQQSTAKFVGSRNALRTELPWMVSLSSNQSDGKHFCSGSILSSTHILTSNYCLEDMDINSMKARVGSNDLDKGGVQYDIVNREYSDSSGLSILCTNKKMYDSTFSDPSRKVTLPTGNTNLAPGIVVRVAGWGDKKTDGTTFTDKLQVVDIPIISLEECKSSYSDLFFVFTSSYMTCVGANGMGSCIGDAGATLSLDGVLYGVAYAGSFPCTYAPGMFIVFNKNLLDWINSIIIQEKCI